MDAHAQRQPNQNDQFNRSAFLKKSTLIYCSMMLIGISVIHFAHESLGTYFGWPSGGGVNNTPWRLLVIVLLGTGVLLSLSFIFEGIFKGFNSLKALFTKLLGPFSVIWLFYLALLSALGEEILFRGALQPAVGLIPTSIIFGLLHIGPGGKVFSWSFWAIFAGFILGWMFENLTNLWPAIFCHFLVNFTAMLQLRLRFIKSSGIKGPQTR